MLKPVIANRDGIAVGDRVWVFDPILTREDGVISAKVLEIRRVLGEQTYLIETAIGDRKLVGANQISQVDFFTG